MTLHDAQADIRDLVSALREQWLEVVARSLAAEPLLKAAC